MGALLTLLLYVIQQGGVLAGAGAAAVGAVWYLRGAHLPQLPATRHTYRVVEGLGLIVMILSGVGILYLHIQAGDGVVLAPAFILKWVLIALLLVVWSLRARGRGFFVQSVVEGFSSANWLALLIIDIAAPASTWPLLLSIYGGWLIFFGLAWIGCVLLLHHPHIARVMPAPKKLEMEVAPQILPAVIVHPRAAPAPVHHAPAPAPHPVVKVAAAPAVPPQKPQDQEASGLPALRVMPKRPEDLNEESRGAVVQFG